MSSPLILASTSPYRKELLGRLGIPFSVCNPDIPETPRPGESHAELALRLAEEKARAVSSHYPDALIIGSDQVAFMGEKRFGKPGNHENAVRQLQTLRGQTVDFLTAVCLLDTRSGVAQVRSVTTRVTFRDLKDADIESYLQREAPYNCAGSAKSEGLGIALISSMESDDPTALIGLPLIALCSLLEAAGVSVL